MKNNFQRCTRCVMDNSSDNSISFDENGVCNYCTYTLERKDKVYFPNQIGEEKLNSLFEKLKIDGKGKKYDCLMGISGGLDSAYLAYIAYEKGLRILAFHINDGFNTEISESNVKNLCAKSNIDLIEEFPDKEQFIDVIRAFFKAGVPGICNAQDNIITSYLYKNAVKFGIRNFLSGSNFSLESILQRGEGINASDGFHIKSISKMFGSKGYDKLPFISLFDSYIKTKYIYKVKMYKPLDFIDYNKDRAIRELNEFCGFNYYGGKHYENVLTYFVQSYYLPNKFGIDKRNSHLSSLIMSNQITREEAILELEKPLYDAEKMDKTIDFICEKLNFTREEFESILNSPPKSHYDYPYSNLNKFAKTARRFRKYLND